MFWKSLNPLSIFPKRCLGIDIGTSSVKVVELSRFGTRVKLENYAQLTATSFFQKPFRSLEKTTLLLSSQDIAKALTAFLEEAKIKAKRAIFSIPDFSSFFTWFQLPPMSREEVATAVRYEARQHIPLPLSEVTLDWQITNGKFADNRGSKVKILLVAVPNEVVSQYQEIANLSRLELWAVEAEVFALSRACVGEKKIIGLIDIGAQSTTVSIIDRGVLKRSHSFDVSGNEFTQRLSQSLSIDYLKAEELKKKYGLRPIDKFLEPTVPYGQDLRKVLLTLCDIIIAEIEKLAQVFYQEEIKGVEKFILAGGTALLPGLRDYFEEGLRREVEIAQPFSNIFCPPILEETLKEIGPSFAIAVGAALRGLE